MKKNSRKNRKDKNATQIPFSKKTGEFLYTENDDTVKKIPQI